LCATKVGRVGGALTRSDDKDSAGGGAICARGYVTIDSPGFDALSTYTTTGSNASPTCTVCAANSSWGTANLFAHAGVGVEDLSSATLVGDARSVAFHLPAGAHALASARIEHLRRGAVGYAAVLAGRLAGRAATDLAAPCRVIYAVLRAALAVVRAHLRPRRLRSSSAAQATPPPPGREASVVPTTAAHNRGAHQPERSTPRDAAIGEPTGAAASKEASTTTTTTTAAAASAESLLHFISLMRAACPPLSWDAS
jgi:hypothetical protein